MILKPGDVVRRKDFVEGFYSYLASQNLPRHATYTVRSCDGIFISFKGVVDWCGRHPTFFSRHFELVKSKPLTLKDWL